MFELIRTLETDLFASRLSHQKLTIIKTYFSRRPDPLSQVAVALQQSWFHKSLYKSSQRKRPHDDPCKSSLAITTVVPRSNENVPTTSNFSDLEERSFKKSKWRNSSPCPKQNFKTSAMDGLKARLQKEEVSRKASNLIIKSRSGANSIYESAWSKRATWCAERKIDPFCSNIHQILEYLQFY